jgi:hypothetical protein
MAAVQSLVSNCATTQAILQRGDLGSLMLGSTEGALAVAL